jgi:hypothetical protein
MFLTDHIGNTVRITYKQPKIDEGRATDSRTGILTAVSVTRALLLVFGEEDEEMEIPIPVKNIKSIRKLKAKD